MNEQFWISVEKQWRQVVSADLIVASCQSIENDVFLIEKNKVVKNIWENFGDDEEDDE